MDVIKVLGNSVAGRDGVSCQETQLLEEMDIIELLTDSVAKSDGKNEVARSDEHN
jgi:hypothetical protein